MRAWTVALRGGGRAHVVSTERADGDFSIDIARPELAARRRRIAPLPWVWLEQVHGPRVVAVEEARDVERAPGTEGDALLTVLDGVALSVQTADCAPVALVGLEKGVIAVAHVGWRGLEAGVLEATVAATRARGETELTAIIGPCISAEAYEFGADDLERLVGVLGDEVRSRTADGRPALDLPAGVRRVLTSMDVALLVGDPPCTASDPSRFYSYRARGDARRHALVVWKELA